MHIIKIFKTNIDRSKQNTTSKKSITNYHNKNYGFVLKFRTKTIIVYRHYWQKNKFLPSKTRTSINFIENIKVRLNIELTQNREFIIIYRM